MRNREGLPSTESRARMSGTEKTCFSGGLLHGV
jgi:hypothetical protein